MTAMLAHVVIINDRHLNISILIDFAKIDNFLEIMGQNIRKNEC